LNDPAKIRSDRSSKIGRLRIAVSVPIRYRQWPSIRDVPDCKFYYPAGTG